jgi:hypothetical protein
MSLFNTVSNICHLRRGTHVSARDILLVERMAPYYTMHTRTSPRALVVTDPCRRAFEWETVVACSVTLQSTPCKAANDKGDVFNLSPLQNVPFDWLYASGTDDGDATRYYVGVCRPLEGSYPGCEKVWSRLYSPLLSAAILP